NVEEANSALQERFDSDFIRCGKRRRRSRTPIKGASSEVKRRETGWIGRLESKLSKCGQVQACSGYRSTIWPGERVGYWDTHVRRAELGEDRTVHIMHQTVDGALGVDDNVDRFGWKTKQIGRLDQLQTLVHKGGAIDGNFAAHAPHRVSTGL